MSESDLIIAPPAVPANSGSAILWDSTYGLIGTPVLNTPGSYRRNWNRHYKRAIVTIYVDQAVTFYARSLASGSSTWRTYNNGGSGDTVVASTLFERDMPLIGDDVQLYILAGGTAPTTWEVSLRLRGSAALSQ